MDYLEYACKKYGISPPGSPKARNYYGLKSSKQKTSNTNDVFLSKGSDWSNLALILDDEAEMEELNSGYTGEIEMVQAQEVKAEAPKIPEAKPEVNDNEQNEIPEIKIPEQPKALQPQPNINVKPSQASAQKIVRLTHQEQRLESIITPQKEHLNKIRDNVHQLDAEINKIDQLLLRANQETKEDQELIDRSNAKLESIIEKIQKEKGSLSVEDIRKLMQERKHLEGEIEILKSKNDAQKNIMKKYTNTKVDKNHQKEKLIKQGNEIAEQALGYAKQLDHVKRAKQEEETLINQMNYSINMDREALSTDEHFTALEANIRGAVTDDLKTYGDKIYGSRTTSKKILVQYLDEEGTPKTEYFKSESELSKRFVLQKQAQALGKLNTIQSVLTPGDLGISKLAHTSIVKPAGVGRRSDRVRLVKIIQLPRILEQGSKTYQCLKQQGIIA